MAFATRNIEIKQTIQEIQRNGDKMEEKGRKVSKDMSSKICVRLGLICLLLGLNQSFVWGQDLSPNSNSDPGQLSSGAAAESLFTGLIPREALERFANLTRDETDASSNLWLLVPRSNLTGDSQSSQSDFELFKLNTNQLFNLGVQHQDSNERFWMDQRHGEPVEQPMATAAPLQMAPVVRGARKLGLFSNVLNKPKVSPLYLVNGTVCRFVNSQPICTTLSTTGLFRGNPNQFNFLNQNPNQNLNQNQNQNGGFFNNNNQQQLPNSRQVSPPLQNNFQQQQGQNFNPQNGFQLNGLPNQQQQQQQFRPLALMDDGTQAVNLTNRSASNVTEQNHSMTVQRASIPRPSPPGYTIVQRRPLNLLSLTRPFRTG